MSVKEQEKGQQIINFSDKLYSKSLQHNLIDESEYLSSYIIFCEYLDELNKKHFICLNKKKKLNFLVTTK